MKITMPKYTQSAETHHAMAAYFISGQLPEQNGIVPNLTRCQHEVMPEHCVCAPCRVRRGQRFSKTSGKWLDAKGKDGNLEAFQTRFEWPTQRVIGWKRRRERMERFTEAGIAAQVNAVIAEHGLYDYQIQAYNPLTGSSQQWSRGTESFGRTIGAARYYSGRYHSEYYPLDPGEYVVRYAIEQNEDGQLWTEIGLLHVTEAADGERIAA